MFLVTNNEYALDSSRISKALDDTYIRTYVHPELYGSVLRSRTKILVGEERLWLYMKLLSRYFSRKLKQVSSKHGRK